MLRYLIKYEKITLKVTFYLPTYIFMVQSFHCPTLAEVRMDKVEEYAKPIPNRF